MKVITSDGETIEFDVGQQMCGRGIVAIVDMKGEETTDPRFLPWFQDCVLTRFMPEGSKHLVYVDMKPQSIQWVPDPVKADPLTSFEGLGDVITALHQAVSDGVMLTSVDTAHTAALREKMYTLIDAITFAVTK